MQHLFMNPKGAILSDCRRYRYALTRIVGDGERACLFVMLNPSTADATEDDPTIRRCMGFARSWGCGRLAVVNLFAFRATSPADMKAASDPVGRDNFEHIREAVRYVTGAGGPIVCAWGNHGAHLGQGDKVLAWLKASGAAPSCLRMTGAGQPSHPLYLPRGLEPAPMEGVAA